MNFADYIQSNNFETKYNLNELQRKVVQVVSEQKDEKVIWFLFEGRKACPYRVVQHLYMSWASKYADDHYQNEGKV